MLVFPGHFLSFDSCITLKLFKHAVCMYALILLLTDLLRNRVCIHSRNVNNKFWIVITSVEQSLQPVDHVW